MLGWDDIKINALAFSKRWKGASREEADAQLFVHELLACFGVDSKRIGTFEFKVTQGERRNGYIDMLWKGRILIEMKSRGKSLEKAFDQARSYAFSIANDEDLPEYIMVCDFENIRLYRQTTNQQWNFKVKDLSKHIKKLSILTEQATKLDFFVDKELNVKAAYKMSALHDILKENKYTGHELEVYLVRLLFCLFADDTGIFHKNQFHQYILESAIDGSDLSGRLATLFDVLNTPKENRSNLLPEDVRSFEYINGGLFKETLRPASFNSKARKILLDCCGFYWGGISPSIFGSMFQGVMNKKERRELGAHYTSESNILRVIKPLFLDDLYAEFERVKSNERQLDYFHKKLSRLKFLDPACGCGNFLIVTYRELRLLELEVLKMKIDKSGQLVMINILEEYIQVNVNQFYGIEYEEFPGQIAQVGMWLMDHQMNNLVADHFGIPFNRLPLKDIASIHYGPEEGNALRINWEDVVAKEELSFILGNPPFLGKKEQNKIQKEELLNTFGKNTKNVSKLDYVSAWYYKAAQYMQGTPIRTAFVSTNSIVQGEQALILWGVILEQFKMKIDFARRSFVWTNEAKGKAAVHCVIIGFSTGALKQKVIYDGDEGIIAKNINPYLVDAPTVFIKSRKQPLNAGPKVNYGSIPIDAGFLVLSNDERDACIKENPDTTNFIRPFGGGEEIINNTTRWCLWLKDADLRIVKKSKFIMERIKKTKEFRLSSSRIATNKLADSPMLFGEIRQPDNMYIAIPKVSSEKRRYIPIAFVESDLIANGSTLIVKDATMYNFGILSSNVHMAWMRTTGGRMKSDYQYSASIVYNTFPWPNPTKEQKEAIEITAKKVLEVRSLYPNNTLAELYDPLTMPIDLLKVHRVLDKQVCKAYGVIWKSEATCVADLMKLYQEITENKDS
ncbi:class I SAM-dependent DNA methyltransferase [Peribacillus sp. NPDC097197]|uniref:class I SAM-dependent DNA methyltransferase n=1 Tax=Peribacillus sp. NPDC097197 TaxID=3390615 RepID=UPI003CFDA06B